jgi:hypothetical protein
VHYKRYLENAIYATKKKKKKKMALRYVISTMLVAGFLLAGGC